jgi:hypothetical protein
MHAYYAPFKVRDRVFIDGDDNMKGTVTGILSRECFCCIEVSYFHNGTQQVVFFEPWRLNLVKL